MSSNDNVIGKIQKILAEIMLLNKSDEITTCFNLLVKLFNNIIEKPKEEKFRTFNKNNEHLKAKVLNIKQVEKLLEVIGYNISKVNDQILILPEENTKNVSICKEEINSYLIKIQEIKNTDLLNNGNKKNNDFGEIKVTLLVYDLSNGMAKQLSPMLLGKRIDGVWHTSILVYDTEYFYGGGICSSKPRKTRFGYPVKELVLGSTEIPKDILFEYLNELKGKFKPENYNLIKHNCNHFSNTLAEFLTGKSIPSDILNQHEALINSKMGSQIMPLLESMNNSP